MKETILTCDRCKKKMDDTLPIEHFYIKVGGNNYVEDFIVQNKDYCRSCISDIRHAIVTSLTMG